MSSDEMRVFEALCIWGYPLVRCLELREKMTQAPVEGKAARSAAAPLGEFGHQKLLSDPSYRVGVAPNVDTLYSVAWLDLADGDLLFETPDFGDRYYAFQFGYFDTSCHTIGQRTHGGHLGAMTISWSPSSTESHVDSFDGGVKLTCNSRFLMIAGRIMVDSSSVEDLEAVHELQDSIRLIRGATYANADRPRSASLQFPDGYRGGPGSQFFDKLSRVLADVPEAALDEEIAQSLRSAGWQPGGLIGIDVTERDLDDAVARGIASIRKGITAAGEIRNGWMVNYRGVDFGRDWLLRASVAMAQIFINPAEEALYPVLEIDDSGQALEGRFSYLLRFPAGELPPVDFFWSLTMYHAEGLLVENSIGRYAIGDRSEHLQYEADGALELVVSHEPPAAGQGNWLPAPAAGFRLMLRLYGPTADCLQGEWSPPPLVRN